MYICIMTIYTDTSMKNTFQYFATCPRNTEDLCIAEITSLGGTNIKETPGGVSFTGTMETGYRHVLWSRIANRLLLTLSSFPVTSADDLYNGTQQISWSDEFKKTCSFTIHTDIIRSTVLGHPNFAARKMKDSIVDQFRERTGERPSIDNKNPDIILHLLIKENTAVVSLDLSGISMHQRGYRVKSGPAPLKENIAAAILLRSGFDRISKEGGSLVDGFCGTGTLLIEGAMIAGDSAPGLMRRKTGITSWEKFDSTLWNRLLEEARERKEAGQKNIPRIFGFDKDRNAVTASLANCQAAGMDTCIHVEKKQFKDLSLPYLAPGLLVSNPPYGERLEEIETLLPLYKNIGEVLQREFKNWQAAIFSGNNELSRAIGLKPERVNILFNGPIACTLARFRIFSQEERNAIYRKAEQKIAARAPATPGAAMFSNRLKKNLKNLKKWANRNGVTSYRIYDADMPEYAAAIDFYEEKWIHFQEYAPPKEIENEKAEQHRREMLDGLMVTLPLHKKDIFIKTRKQQRGKGQYEKTGRRGKRQRMHENGHVFLINLSDYLDTGIFLDHRLTRHMIASMAPGKDFLNLFAYTGTASVYAASGGARSTTTLDKSNTYLQWARENMEENGYTQTCHRFIKADCLQWLATTKEMYDLIFLDPPTFSNSKTMNKTLAIQRDYKDLIEKSSRLLRKNGILLFSTNFKKFKMDRTEFPRFTIEDISEKTIPRDFERNKKIHYCWIIRRK